MATALGASVGIAVLVGTIPVLRSVVLLFGPAEFFGLALLGLAVIAVVSAGSLARGLLAGVLGLLLGLHGFNPITGVSRYDLGLVYLQEGIPLLPVFIGMFAFAQAMTLLLHHQAVSEAEAGGAPMALGSGLVTGVLSVFRHFGLFFRCSVLGTIVGAIPGPGGTVATFLAYGHARQTAKDTSLFGKGDIRGVIAPESANDAKDGGSLIPTLAFGVPGTISAGIILLALQFHGIRVGPELLGPNLATVFVLLTSLFLSNWITSLVGLATGRWLVRLTTVPTSIIGPAVLVLSFFGALANRGLFEDVIVMVISGLLGYVFMRRNIPVVPLVIALLLASVLENSLSQLLQIGDGTPILLFTRPVSVGILILVVVTLLSPLQRNIFARRRATPEGVG
jgi:putative tricarboxylic transport membrane protein